MIASLVTCRNSSVHLFANPIKREVLQWRIGLKQMATAERILQEFTRALKMYITDVSQQDLDDYAERLTCAINTAHERVYGNTPYISSTYRTCDRRWKQPF